MVMVFFLVFTFCNTEWKLQNFYCKPTLNISNKGHLVEINSDKRIIFKWKGYEGLDSLSLCSVG